MSEALERIWAMAPHIGEFFGDPPVNAEDQRFLTEYVRADLFNEQAARIERLEAALKPFAFFEPEDPEDSAQKAWEQVYQDRIKDWIDFEEIAAARSALKESQS